MTTLHEIERDLDPFPMYKEMRENNPVFYDPDRFNWNIYCYDDVQRGLSDYSIFSSQYQRDRNLSTTEPFAASMISTDPPRHRQLRSLVTQVFTPKAVDQLAPRIQAIVAEYLDKMKDQDHMEVVADLAYPLPVTVIAEMMGIPVEDREKFKHWSDRIVSFADTFEQGGEFAWDNTVMEMVAYFLEMIQQRKLKPQSDLISGLLQANIDGQYLDLPELLGFCVLLLVAGNETTTNLIANAMWTFAEHSNAWQMLRLHPELLPNAIEEVLRYRSPVQSMFRNTLEDVEISGIRIPKRSMVSVWIGSANRDVNQFPNPDTFDIKRSPNRHLAFGNGIHYCLGAPLARLEAKIALGALLERIPAFELEPGAHLERLPSLIVYGPKSVPIQIKGK
jgi:cytochrome P450